MMSQPNTPSRQVACWQTQITACSAGDGNMPGRGFHRPDGAKVTKSAWQLDTEQQLTEMAYRISALEEENEELIKMLRNITLYLCGESIPTNTT